ncbi:hypothetical protein KEM54_001822 [Ascosphaera aggregata]|nr:hypothetical protein KEM54_001822 [Ascosphaera aggregata]
MATAYKIQVTPGEYAGSLKTGPRADSAQIVSQLLQDDMQRHDIYFNDKGFHMHHLLTDWVLGASPDDLQKSYETNSSYQIPSKPVEEEIVQKFEDRTGFRQCLGQRAKYVQYLVHFQREIDSRGVEDVLQEYLFAGDDFADDMFTRLFASEDHFLYADFQMQPELLKWSPEGGLTKGDYLSISGFLHPWIQLGFGLEFEQPAIVAQALAETATHANEELSKFFLNAEQKANQRKGEQSAHLVEIQKNIYESQAIRESVLWEDAEKLNFLIRRAASEIIDYTSQFRVDSDNLDEKMAEVMNAAAYAMGVSQRTDKPVKFDFYYLHCVTSNIFLPTFLALPWLSQTNKVRLLEWKARADLALYASRRPPQPLLHTLTNYPAKRNWGDVALATITHPNDDGHASKIVRSLILGERVCRPYYDREGFPVKEDMWLKMGNMCKCLLRLPDTHFRSFRSIIADPNAKTMIGVDSIYPPGPITGRWVFSCGFDEAWDD